MNCYRTIIPGVITLVSLSTLGVAKPSSHTWIGARSEVRKLITEPSTSRPHRSTRYERSLGSHASLKCG